MSAHDIESADRVDSAGPLRTLTPGEGGVGRGLPVCEAQRFRSPEARDGRDTREGRDGRDGRSTRDQIALAVRNFRDPVYVVTARDGGRAVRLSTGGSPRADEVAADDGDRPVGFVPGLYPEWLGSRLFGERFGCRFAYAVGEMARAIASVDMVRAAVEAGFFGGFGSAGLSADDTRAAARALVSDLGAGAAWGMNLINAADGSGRERRLVDIFLEEGVRNVSASAFMRLSPEIVRFSARGLSRRPDGSVARSTNVLAKVSRDTVARQFMAPPPADMLRQLVAAGDLTEVEADLQSVLPVAETVTVEGDSGGHTDGRPLPALFESIAALRDELVRIHAYGRPILVGAAGGLGTPKAVAAAFQLGADYVLTGSVNQACVESGLSDLGRRMLAEAGVADFARAPAADMFEVGADVQVLKRGTTFALNGRRLHEIYRRHERFEDASAKDRDWVETHILAEPFASAWEKTRAWLAEHVPNQLALAEQDHKLRMAKVFRRYLFQGAQWAREGSAEHARHFQIWSGPAMGAFNGWSRGSFLEEPENRTVAQVGLNLLEGAAQVTRAQQLRSFGVPVPPAAFDYRPAPLAIEA